MNTSDDRVSGNRPAQLLGPWTAVAVLATWAPVLLFMAVIIVLMLPGILEHEPPNYVDQMGHLLRLWFLTENASHGSIVPLWMPTWYSGTDFLRYYPPLATYLMLPIDLMLRNPVDTYFVFGALLSFGTCVTMYMFARGVTGRIGATMAALAYAFSQLTLLSYWYEGNLGRTTAAFLAPVVFMTACQLMKVASARAYALLSVSIAALILAHSMQGLMFLSLLSTLVITLAIGSRNLAGLVRIALSTAVGMGLSLFWLLPSITHFDLPNVPNLFTEKVYLYSAGPDIFNTLRFREDVFAAGYFGIPVVAIAVAGFLLTLRSAPRSTQAGLLLAMTAGLLLSFGTNLGSWYADTPILGSMLPLRFLLAALLPAGVLVGMAIQTVFNATLARSTPRGRSLYVAFLVGVTGVLAWDYSPGLTVVRPGGATPIEVASRQLAGQSQPGRVLVFSPEGSATSYWPTVAGEKRQVFGWAIEGTIQNEAIPLMNQAIRDSWDDYLAHLYSLWNVEHVLLGGESLDVHASRFEAMGYRVIERLETEPLHLSLPYLLLASSEPTSPVMRLDRDVLAIGVGAPGLQLPFPWITRGQWQSLESYDPEFLAQFKAIVMWEPVITDAALFEKRVRSLLRDGKLVAIDPGRIFGTIAFGVSSIPLEMEGSYTLSTPEDVQDFTGVGELGPFSYSGSAWRGRVYSGTDGAEASLQKAGASTAQLLTYKEIDGHRLYFVGADLFQQILVNKDTEAVAFLGEFLGRVNPNTDTIMQPLASRVEPGLDHMRVSVEMPDDGWVVLSESYSPAWHIVREGKSIRHYPYENMISFPLPQGRHTLLLSYNSTFTQKVSLGLSVVSLAALVLTSLLFRRIFRV